MIPERRFSALGAAAFMVVIQLASATGAEAFDGFMKAQGITGESEDVDHQGWSDILSYNQVARPFALPGCKFVVTKLVDSATVPLIEKGSLGDLGKLTDVTIELVRTGETRHVFYRAVMSGVEIVRMAVAGNTGAPDPGGPVERLFLTADAVVFTYTPQTPTGGAGTPIEASIGCGD
jgi:type VI protein secretion system component Hcp